MSEVGFEIRLENVTKEKSLYATKAFKAGDIIFQEKPIVCCQFSWNSTYGYLCCHHCMRPLETAENNARRLTGDSDLKLPYSYCCTTDQNTMISCSICGTMYCSNDCQQIALEQYHSLLCPLMADSNSSNPLSRLIDTWKQIHYPPETCSIMLLVRIIAMIQQSSNQTAMIDQFLQFCHRTVNEDLHIVHKLLGEQFTCQLEMLRNLMLETLPCEGIEEWLSQEGFQRLFALVGTNGQGVGTSPLSSWYDKCSLLNLPEEEKQQFENFIDKLYADLELNVGQFINNEGSALYSLQSKCNHSCEPNAEPTFPNNNYELYMSAISDISPGDEIVVSYLDQCILTRSRHTRQKILAKNYLFICKCSKCELQSEEMDITSDEGSDDESDEERN